MRYTTSALNSHAKRTVQALTFGGLLLAASLAGAATYQFKVSMPGLVAPGVSSAVVPPPPSATGDGTSKAGACASGVQSTCIAWNATGVDPRITVSGTPLLSLRTTDCHRTSDNSCTVRGTKSYSSGKWYWEYTITTVATGGGGFMFGAVEPGGTLDNAGVGFYSYNNGALRGYAVGPLTNSGYQLGDVFGFALDMDAKTLYATRNGLPLFGGALPASMLAAVTPAAGEHWNVAPNGLTANFGKTNFQYAVPSGFNAGLW